MDIKNNSKTITISFDEIKKVITDQVGRKARIKRLEIDPVGEGAKLDAEIDAGMLGGKIAARGFMVNTSDGIALRDMDVEARGYVKSQIEKNLPGFDSVIKEYFEKQSGKKISRIQIVGSNLVIEFAGEKK